MALHVTGAKITPLIRLKAIEFLLINSSRYAYLLDLAYVALFFAARLGVVKTAVPHTCKTRVTRIAICMYWRIMFRYGSTKRFV